MIKKFIIFLFIFFGFVANAYASSDDSMLAATFMFIKRGMITTPSWAKPIDDKKAFSQYDSKSNEIARFLICSHSSIDKYDNNGYDRLNEFYYYGGYIDLYNLDNNPKITAKFKFAGDTIYEYDNKPDKKKGILGALGFYEDGPGHLVAYAKISPDGVLTKFDAFDNKITSFKFTDNKTIKQYDANGNSIGHYKLFTYNEVFPKKNSSTTTNSGTTPPTINTYSVVPISIVWAKSNKFSNSSSNSEINNSTSISIYDGAGYPDGRISVFGSSISVYDSANHYIGRFDISGSRISVYDSSSKPAGSIYVSGSSASEYNAKGNFIGSYSLFEDSITEYNSSGYPGGTYDISDGSISIYTSSGYPAGSFDF